jgi:small-conductance mechanosensitive channel
MRMAGIGRTTRTGARLAPLALLLVQLPLARAGQVTILPLILLAQALEIFGVRFVGVSVENAKKFFLTAIYVATVFILARILRALATWILRGRHERIVFWVRQAIQILTTILLLLGLASIWFEDPARLATALALIAAGLAFALQKVVTAVAGYFVILRGKTFNVGDRITMGGVRGDVIALGFIQTRIMEMGQPPSVEEQADPAMWVQSRQYTGRIVTVSNARIFDEPVYNYSLDFPFLWEEMRIPITYTANRQRAEEIMLAAAKHHTVDLQTLSQQALEDLQRRYFLKPTDLGPSVYYRLTDNWLELTVRFITEIHGIRNLKNKMSREILQKFDEAGIGIASTTFDIVGLPPLRVEDGKGPGPSVDNEAPPP